MTVSLTATAVPRANVVEWRRPIFWGVRSTLVLASDVSQGLRGAYVVRVDSNVNQLRVPQMATSDFDIRHWISTAVYWKLPMPVREGPPAVLVRGWTLDGIVRASTARPLKCATSSLSR